jgi:hypothetical protein
MKSTRRSPTAESSGSLQIELVDTPEAAHKWLERGYTPIECSFGDEVVIDDLQMDHHGPLSHLEGVALRAYRDHFGARRDDPRFVVAGFPDEDATFAIASLAAVIPHPSLAEDLHGLQLKDRAAATKNLLGIASEINQVDLDPDLAIKLTDTHWGLLILTFRQQGHPTNCDRMAWFGGVDRWRNILTAQSDDFSRVASDVLEKRLREVQDAEFMEISSDVVVVDFSRFGRNSTYYEQWTRRYPVLVAFIGGPEGPGVCSFVGRNLATLVPLFGDSGFLAHYLTLLPPGCGGREVIGGSSRSRLVTWNEAIAYGQTWQEIIEDHRAHSQ